MSKGKVVIVTGGLSGIGHSTVRQLLKHGAKHVAILDLNSDEEKTDKCMNKLENEFGENRVGFYSCDVTEKSVFAARYDEIVGSQRSVDVLINNAGVFRDSNPEREIDVNFKGVVNCTLVAIDRMRRQHKGNGGIVINLCSIAGLMYHPAIPVYVGTKYAIYGFTKSLKEYEELLGVRVMAVCPGVTKTNLFSLKDTSGIALDFVPQEFVEEVLTWQPLQSPENVANCIIKMLEKGKAGDVWVSELDQPPYIVADPEPYPSRSVPV